MFRNRQEDEIPLGVLQPTLQPFFPDWQHNLVLTNTEFRAGIFVFKAGLSKDLWRRIAISADAALHSLSSAILDAYRFDDDHLYCFICTNRFGVRVEFVHPYMDEGPFADEVRVGDLPLAVGQSMVYNYDFGDHWEFVVTLERIDPPNPRQKKAKMLEKQGQAPKQYGEW